MTSLPFKVPPVSTEHDVFDKVRRIEVCFPRARNHESPASVVPDYDDEHRCAEHEHEFVCFVFLLAQETLS